jgi:hypothetical protein
MLLLYTLQYRSGRWSTFCISICILLFPFTMQHILTPCEHEQTLGHHTIALARPDVPLLRPHIQIDRTDELEEGIVIRFRVPFFQPLVPPDQ